MAYSIKCHVRDTGKNTIHPYPRQEENTIIPKRRENTPFGARLIEAFNGASKKEIADKLGVDTSTVTDYTLNGVYPTGAGLLRIAEITHCNLHWLMTGEGEPGGSLDDLLPDPERAVVQRIAEIYGIEVEAVIKDLIDEALLERGAFALSRYTHLHDDQRHELEAIFDLFLREASLRPRHVTKNRA